MFQWCIEYHVLFPFLPTNQYKLVVYERLIIDPHKEFEESFGYIRIPKPPE